MVNQYKFVQDTSLVSPVGVAPTKTVRLIINITSFLKSFPCIPGLIFILCVNVYTQRELFVSTLNTVATPHKYEGN